MKFQKRENWTNKSKQFKMPFIGLGTAAIGRPQYINIRQDGASKLSLDAFKKKGIDVLNTAYEQGIRYFDTAPNYGIAEQLLISWLKGKEDSNIEVATKWGYTYVANFDPNATQHEVKEHSLEKLNEQWEQSKMLLPSLSTYQIHSATFETGVLENQEILNRLNALKEDHGLKIGITTTGSKQVEVIKRALDVQLDGKQLFDTFQVTYNILDQSIAIIVNDLKRQGKRIIIKEALANGRLFPNAKYPGYAKLYDSMGKIAKKYSVGVDAIALRFCMDSIAPFTVLSGASLSEHLTDNLKALDIKLEETELEEIKSHGVSPLSYWDERKKLGWN